MLFWGLKVGLFPFPTPLIHLEWKLYQEAGLGMKTNQFAAIRKDLNGMGEEKPC